MTIIASDIGGRIVVLPSPVERPAHARPRMTILTRPKGAATTLVVTLEGLSRADTKTAKQALKQLETCLRYVPANHEATVLRILKRQQKDGASAVRTSGRKIRRGAGVVGRAAVRA